MPRAPCGSRAAAIAATRRSARRAVAIERRRRAGAAGSGRSRRTARRRRRRRARRSRAAAPSPTRTTSGSPKSRRTARRSARSGRSRMPTPSGLTTNSWWSVPKCSATRRAHARARRTAGSSKPIENVLTRVPDDLRHQADDEARVDAAGEERAERHVADQMRADGVAQHARAAASTASSSDPGERFRRPASASTVRSRRGRRATSAGGRAAACGRP